MNVAGIDDERARRALDRRKGPDEFVMDRGWLVPARVARRRRLTEVALAGLVAIAATVVIGLLALMVRS